MMRVAMAVLAVGLCLVVALLGSAYHLLTRSGERAAPVSLEVAPGEPLAEIARRLHGHEVIPNRRLWLVWARASGADTRIHAGEYRIGAASSATDVLEQLARGEVVQRRVTLVEGMRFGEIRELLERMPRLEVHLAGLPDTEVMARLGRPGVHPEGRFFPDTYGYTAGTSDLDLLRAAMLRMDRELAAAWEGRDPGLRLDSPEDLLVLASIVEKETGLDAERSAIAGVFVRRLERGMRLQTDPTVIYGLGDAFDGNLTRAHLRADTPWNTYVHRGLPPTPICSPGRRSLEAAAWPEGGDAMYFVARGDGSSEFSATLDAHNAAVRRYQLGQPEPGDGRP